MGNQPQAAFPPHQDKDSAQPTKEQPAQAEHQADSETQELVHQVPHHQDTTSRPRDIE